VNHILEVIRGLRSTVQWRALFAYALMGAFVVLPPVGAFLIYGPSGWIVAGLTSGLVGYVLGRE
jgi:hypothetical protein